MHASHLRRMLFVVLLLVPPVYLIISNQGIADLLRNNAPDGQLSYIISRLLGMYAFIILCWQAIAALLEKTNNNQSSPSHIKRHILMGSSIVLLILLHSGLFINAVSARAGQFSLGPLVPDFSGYYSTALTLGVLALLFTLIAVTSGMLRKRLKTHWKLGHGLMFIVLGLVFSHAWMIGSDVRSALLLPLFLLAAGGVIALILRRAQTYF